MKYLYGASQLVPLVFLRIDLGVVGSDSWVLDLAGLDGVSDSTARLA